ncbi:MAG: ABC transporter ATP-binding protein [Acidimicrobiia bacterium]|nr:ABC transporter ATP-binding protein [Acidimicrobiia bacterium]
MTAAIETHQLTKRYGAARGIEELDLRVGAGVVFGFLGPNGAGKSTTIRTLLDFQRPTSGAATLLGLDSRRDSVEIRTRVGYLPGDLHLFDRMTGGEHLAWFARARGVHDEHLTGSLVERFGITMDRPVQDLSKGNRQKVGLLLAFMHAPELLILDEPTAGLDPLMQAEFEQLVRETTAAGRTVLLSSHSLSEVQQVADRVAIIRDGRLIVSDTVDRLRARAPRVMQLQFRHQVDADPFRRIPGATRVEAIGTRLDLHVHGDVAPVLEAALAQGVIDLTAHQADLDELFLAYYRDEPEPRS